MSSTNGIQGFSIHETPIAVIDLETTGLTPGLDRVVEVSVYRLKPWKTSYLAFDTMVNPLRPMFTTGIYLSNLENSMTVCPNLAGHRENKGIPRDRYQQSRNWPGNRFISVCGANEFNNPYKGFITPEWCQ